MLKTNVYDMSGKLVGEIELSEAVFGITPIRLLSMTLSRTTWLTSVRVLSPL